MSGITWLGNLDGNRDWGFAGDFVKAMWRMLQAAEPDDYVVATGETHTVREFCELAFARVGLPIYWEGSGAEEQGRAVTAACLLPWIPGTSGRPKWIYFLVMPVRLAKLLAGSRRSCSKIWST